jgi:hypothetical protein
MSHVSTDIGKPVLYPLHSSEQEITLERHRGDAYMTLVLTNAYAVHASLDHDIKSWQYSSTGSVPMIIDWLKGVSELKADPTPYDYRRYARAHAAALLFKIIGHQTPAAMASRTVFDDRWTKEQKLEYWRCVAICSAAWRET